MPVLADRRVSASNIGWTAVNSAVAWRRTLALNRSVASTKAAMASPWSSDGTRPAWDFHHRSVSTTAARSRLEIVKCSFGRPTAMNGRRFSVGWKSIVSAASP